MHELKQLPHEALETPAIADALGLAQRTRHEISPASVPPAEFSDNATEILAPRRNLDEVAPDVLPKLPRPSVNRVSAGASRLPRTTAGSMTARIFRDGRSTTMPFRVMCASSTAAWSERANPEDVVVSPDAGG